MKHHKNLKNCFLFLYFELLLAASGPSLGTLLLLTKFCFRKLIWELKQKQTKHRPIDITRQKGRNEAREFHLENSWLIISKAI
jgi:hypothetical protein